MLPNPKWFIPAVIAYTLIFYCVALSFAEEYGDEEIVNAIYKAEGEAKTSFPYGIKSVKCEGEAECRQICLNSVRNGRKRWIKAGKPEDLITFISRRYCPLNDKNDVGGLNKNWVKNVSYFLERGRK